MWRSISSASFSPPGPRILMPLSSAGLWDAEITTPAAQSLCLRRWETAGVGSTPAQITEPPPAWKLEANHRARSFVDARVSPARRIRGSGHWRARSSARATPRRRTVSSSSGDS
jgi:hypothetical protein